MAKDGSRLRVDRLRRRIWWTVDPARARHFWRNDCVLPSSIRQYCQSTWPGEPSPIRLLGDLRAALSDPRTPSQQHEYVWHPGPFTGPSAKKSGTMEPDGARAGLPAPLRDR